MGPSSSFWIGSHIGRDSSLLVVAFLQLEVDLEIELEVDLEIELEAASLVASHLKPSSSMDNLSHGVQHSCT